MRRSLIEAKCVVCAACGHKNALHLSDIASSALINCSRCTAELGRWSALIDILRPKPASADPGAAVHPGTAVAKDA